MNCNIPSVAALKWNGRVNHLLMSNGTGVAPPTCNAIAPIPLLPPMEPLAAAAVPTDYDSNMNCLFDPCSIMMGLKSLHNSALPTPNHPMVSTALPAPLLGNAVVIPSLETLQLMIQNSNQALLTAQMQRQVQAQAQAQSLGQTQSPSSTTSTSVGESDDEQQQQQQGTWVQLDSTEVDHGEQHPVLQLQRALQMKDELRVENQRLLYEVQKRDNVCQRQSHKLDVVRAKNREYAKTNTALKKEIKAVRQRLREFSLQSEQVSELKQRSKSECEMLQELYLNSGAIKNYLGMVKQYGEHFDRLKTRQCNLTACVGKEDSETVKIRMRDVYADIVTAEKSYQTLFESLDIMKTESQGKELELMTSNREHITVLEQEIRSKSTHLEEYVKQNQALQQSLADREMKLRQSQNKVSHLQKKLSQTQWNQQQRQQQQQPFNDHWNGNYKVYGMDMNGNGNNSFFNPNYNG